MDNKQSTVYSSFKLLWNIYTWLYRWFTCDLGFLCNDNVIQIKFAITLDNTKKFIVFILPFIKCLYNVISYKILYKNLNGTGDNKESNYFVDFANRLFLNWSSRLIAIQTFPFIPYPNWTFVVIWAQALPLAQLLCLPCFQ